MGFFFKFILLIIMHLVFRPRSQRTCRRKDKVFLSLISCLFLFNFIVSAVVCAMCSRSICDCCCWTDEPDSRDELNEIINKVETNAYTYTNAIYSHNTHYVLMTERRKKTQSKRTEQNISKNVC